MPSRLLTPLLALLLTANLRAQPPQSVETPYPKTGLDFSSADAFWPMVDLLVRDTNPTDAQWKSMLGTPGYRLAQMAIGPVVREDMELAFKPSKRTAFDSLTKLTNDRATRLMHLARALTLRPKLIAFRDSMTRSAPIREALAAASRYLPPGATASGEPPLVAFAIFRNDGYSMGPGVIVDLLNAYESNLVLFLAHEFHHTYLDRVEEIGRIAGERSRDDPNIQLVGALQALRNEGIADLIDKTYPLASENPVRANYVRRYNDEYSRTPETFHQLDSLLLVVASDSAQALIVGPKARTLLWSNSHPNGAYVARTIYETFGVDSLFPGVKNPAAFLRTFVAAERVRGRPAPFSPKSWALVESYEQRYWRQKP